MNGRIYSTVLVAIAMGFAFPLHAQTSIADLTRRSSIIFSAKIEKAHGTTNGVSAGESDAIARVDRVLDAPKEIGILPKQTLTIRLAGGREGDRRIFFTQAYFIAATLGVNVVGSLPADKIDDVALE